MIARLAAMLQDERGTAVQFRGTSSRFNGRATLRRGAPTPYASLLQALKDGYQVYNQAPGIYFLRQRFAEGWKFAQVTSRDQTTGSRSPHQPFSSL
jgi:hypothetical protein